LMNRPWRGSNVYRSSGSAAAVNPSGIWTTTAYDKLGRVISVTTADNAVITTAYSGNQLTITDQAGKTRRSVSDALSRITQVVEDPNGLAYQTDYTYDAVGNLRRVAQGSQNRYFMYDSLSRLIRAMSPEQNANAALALTDSVTGNSQWAMAYAYDNNGNLSTRTDARGVVTNYVYDSLNRNTQVNYSDGSNIVRVYDGSTNGRGRFWGAWWNPTNGTNTHTAIDGYDAMGRPLYQRQQFYNGSDWGVAYNVSRTYDLAGNVTSQTYPSGRSVSYSYDQMGRTTSFTGNLGDSVSRTYMTALAFDDSGRMIREQFGTDTPLYNKRHYNVRGQLYDIRLSSVNDDGDWDRGAVVNYYSLANYGFGTSGTDNNGNLYVQQHWIPGGSYMQQNYAYDSLNRITSVGEYQNGATNTGTQSYTYDRYGNRTINASSFGTGINIRQFTVDAATNRLGVPSGQAGVMQYDANGNLLSDTYTSYGSRTYDAENRMVTAWDSSGQLSSYTYDADGRRVRRKVGVQTEVWQVYSMNGELLAEYAANAAATSPQIEYGYRNGELLVTASSGANVQWMVTDQLGTPRMIADRTGSLAGIKRHDYLPFGEELLAGTGGRVTAQGYVADGLRQKYTQKERDNETGLDYFVARYYASIQGRFTSADPLYLEMGRLSDPQRLNLYSYTRNNPLKFVDHLGFDITLKGSKKDAYTENLNEDLSFKTAVDPETQKVVIVDQNGKPLDQDALRALGSKLKGGEALLFKAIVDKNVHVTIDTGDGRPNSKTFFAASDQHGNQTLDFHAINMLDDAKNKGGLTASQVVKHETVEAYLEAAGGDHDLAHLRATQLFGALYKETLRPDGRDVLNAAGTHIVGNVFDVQIVNPGAVMNTTTRERITVNFDTPIPVKGAAENRNSTSFHISNVEAVPNQ